MACCGNKRVQFQAQRGAVSQAGPPRGRPLPQPAMPVRVVFEYSGQAPLIVIGPVSGKRYRFEGAGVRVEVDPRDRRSLVAIPRLRQVG